MNATSGENNLVIKANFSVPRLKFQSVYWWERKKLDHVYKFNSNKVSKTARNA